MVQEHTAQRFRLGVDIGGTFTDVVLLADDGSVRTAKVLSTPDDYARGVVDGAVALLAEHGIDPHEIADVVHASTVASNTILEGHGARTALVTTEGFRDVLEMRRLRIPVLYDIQYEVPPPLVPRRRRYEVRERLGPRGEKWVELDEESVRVAARQIREQDVEAVAIALLHAYADDEHERRVEAIVRETVGDDVYVTRSSEILPEIREYERTSTTVVNGYVGPAITRYLGSLVDRLQAAGIEGQLDVMQSSGGTLTPETAERRPAHLIESGPAAGVIACSYLGRLTGRRQLISLDMGGTTAKAAIVEDGLPVRTTEYEVGAGINLSSKLVKGGGHPIKLPFIDVSEIGAGGGSIVVDRPARLGERRPAKRGVRSGAGVLRDRRRRADAHGRAARARVPRRRATRRRRDHARSGAGASGARPRGGDATRAVDRGGSARHPAARRRDHDPRGEGRHDVPGPRPPRLHALCVRGQRRR